MLCDLCVRRRHGWAGFWIAISVFAASGCAGRTITFNKDIAPIVFEHCAGCHRPGQLAPFSLLTYADVNRRLERVVDSVTRRDMPPWLPERGVDSFVNERVLTEDQIETIRRWAEAGAVEGNPSDSPPAPVFGTGWQLGQPDLVLELPQPYTLQAGNTDVFRNFVIPVPIESRRFVRGVEFRPGRANVIHHAVMGVDRTRTSRRLDAADAEPGYEGMLADTFDASGLFAGWTPGQAAAFEGPDLAWPLNPGDDLVLQLHLLPSRAAVALSPEIGLFFSDTPPTRSPLLLKVGTTTIDIPAGEAHYTVTDRFVLPVDVEVLSVYPHAHYLGKEITASTTLPDGSTKPLISIKNWDFMWQDVYRYRTPRPLPRGSTIDMRFTYDNSAANPRNPHQPPQRVMYGPRPSDEMGNLWLQVITRSADEEALLVREQAQHRLQAALPRTSPTAESTQETQTPR